MTRSVLLDENFPRAIASGLRAAGHDVASVGSLAPGLDDRGVLAMARDEIADGLIAALRLQRRRVGQIGKYQGQDARGS